MITGNVLSFGGGVADIAAYIICSGSGSKYTTLGTNSSAACIYGVDDALFDYTSGVFTAKKAGTYTLHCYVRGAYNSSGNARYCYFKIFQNGTVIQSVTSGSAYPNAGGTITYTITVAVSDTLSFQQASSGGAVGTTMGVVIQNV